MRKSFLQLAAERVVVLDGAMGTSIHTYDLDLHRDWLNMENCSEILILSRPDVIREIHESYLAVGCDAVETNTFGANKIVLAEFQIPEKTFEINLKAAHLAREAANKFQTPDNPKYVVGSIGPGTKILTLGQTTWDVMLDSYTEQCRGLIAGGVDALLIETSQDLLQVKCAINAATDAMKQAAVSLPIMVQVSWDLGGQKMLLGTETSAVVASIEPYAQVASLGMNCATGPTEMLPHVQYLSKNWPRLISVLPNAGLPVMVDGKTHFPLVPDDFAKQMIRFVKDHGVNVVGGCCGTQPAHLKALVNALADLAKSGAVPTTPDGRVASRPRTLERKPQISSLMAAEDVRQELSYLIVAERTNTNGSRQFKRLLQSEDWDGLVSMARDEVRDGSHVLDLCVDFVGRDGVRDMHEVAFRYVNQLQPGVPLMLDSTFPKVLEAGLKLCGGRCILNSMNLEDGEERIAEICNLAKRYGAAVVAGTIDEDKLNAMARTSARKISIAKRIRDLAVNVHGLRDEDLFFDPLVLPISTGIEEDRKNALETIEGIRLISTQLPSCHTVVGLSNVSFGLKPAARVVLNSCFLHECREAGLTGAIVHASKILPRTRIDDARWNAALDLIYDRRRDGFDPLTAFISLFPDDEGTTAAKPPEANLPIEEKLKRHVIDGEKRDLIPHLDQALTQYSALHIINNILLEGMKVVGELFGSGQMQLPFVLQSAETMKASVAHLEKFMEKIEGSSKGRIVLATVKGDVHDIGKNLVDIILTNNGYTVFNLGIKQPIEDILKAFEDKKADAIGMSGLLVKSVAVMKENLDAMNARAVVAPVLLGGAALTRDYAEDTLASNYGGALMYCKDAFDGLAVMDRIAAGQLNEVVAEQKARTQDRKDKKARAVKPVDTAAANVEPVAKDNPVPLPPFWGRRIIRDVPARSVFDYVNQTALFRGQWGFKQGKLTPEEFEKSIEEKARPVFESLKRRNETANFIRPAIAYGYFPVQAQGNELIVYHTEEFAGCTCHANNARLIPAAKPREHLRFPFPRQQGRRNLCITDFYRTVDSGEYDVLGIQLVTVGDKASELAEELRKADKYQDYLYLHGFGVESAEGLAELWHKRMRTELGFSSEDSPSVRDLFQQKYRGSRYSFGYPACPDLELRAKIVQLLHPEEIGVTLSENFMLIPEQSTDAIIAHHPQAKYFDV